MGWAKDELEKRENAEPILDEDGNEWVRKEAGDEMECAHCDEVIDDGEVAYHSGDDDDRWLHIGCLDGFLGYQHAMNKDD